MCDQRRGICHSFVDDQEGSLIMRDLYEMMGIMPLCTTQSAMVIGVKLSLIVFSFSSPSGWV